MTTPPKSGEYQDEGEDIGEPREDLSKLRPRNSQGEFMRVKTHRRVREGRERRHRTEPFLPPTTRVTYETLTGEIIDSAERIRRHEKARQLVREHNARVQKKAKKQKK